MVAVWGYADIVEAFLFVYCKRSKICEEVNIEASR